MDDNCLHLSIMYCCVTWSQRSILTPAASVNSYPLAHLAHIHLQLRGAQLTS